MTLRLRVFSNSRSIRLQAGGERGSRGWDDGMASQTRWMWVWANSGREWRTGKINAEKAGRVTACYSSWGHRIGHHLATEQQMPRLQKQLRFPGGVSGNKEATCQCRKYNRGRFDPWVGKIPQRRAWQPTPVVLPRDPMDRGAWWATVHGGAKSRMWQKGLSTAHSPHRSN